MARTPKKKEYPDLICGIPRANLEQFARFICPYVEAYYADEKTWLSTKKRRKATSFHITFTIIRFQKSVRTGFLILLS